jgi:hypothetical protein
MIRPSGASSLGVPEIEHYQKRIEASRYLDSMFLIPIPRNKTYHPDLHGR